MRVGLAGCGSIGREVVKAIIEGKLPGFSLVGIFNTPETEFNRRLAGRAGCPLLKDIGSLLALAPDLVVEAASQQAVRDLAPLILERGINLMIVSVGALADAELFRRLNTIALGKNCRIHVPSGAIGGLDLVKSAAVAGLDECCLTTRKSLRALAGVPYIAEKGIRLEDLAGPTVVYEGPAAEAVRIFPQNVNVAASIGLAGIGLDRTMVRIVADPSTTRNTHEVYLKGAFGEATVRLENLASPDNPKTSYLASLSVIAALQGLLRPIRFGT